MKIRRLLVFIVIVSAIAAPVAALQGIEEAEADIAVRQPGWVESAVDTEQVSGQTAYVVRGEEIRIAPQNFNVTNVIDFGVETDVGSMSYDHEFGEYVFEPQVSNGTFEVFWIVAEQRVVTDGNESQLRTVQVRYSALIRVQGGVSFVHVPESRLQENQRMTELGRTVNESIGDLRDRNLPLALNSGSDEEIFQAMITRYVNTGNPIAALTGNYTTILIIIGTTLGGLLWAAQYFGILAYVIRSLRGRLNRFEMIESQEGSIADRQAEMKEMERAKVLQNTDWNDIFENDHIAYAFRQVFGETPHDGYQKLVATQILPEVWLKDRIAAMGKSGWEIVEDDDSVEFVRPDEDVEDSVPIEEQEVERVVDKADWNDERIRTFDLPNADFDLSDFDDEPTTLSLSELIEELNIQMSEFESEKQVGQYLRDYLEFVKGHDYTDEDGRVRTSREMLNEWLKLSQLLGDRYGFPETHFVEQAINRALIDWDPSDQARTLVTEVQDGR